MIARIRGSLLMISLLALTLVNPIYAHLWEYKSETLIQVQKKQQIVFNNPVMQADLDQDGQNECLQLKDNQAILYKPLNKLSVCGSDSNNLSLWNSPANWMIKQAEITDLNRDGNREITLLVWRKFSPWPIDKNNPAKSRIKDFHNAAGLSCHLILIGWKLGKYREVWAGSALAEPLEAFSSADINNDGHEELIVTERNYDDPFWRPATTLSIWEWNGFGFTRLTRINGFFNHLYTMGSSQKTIYIMTQ
jgi:hypothetical protein